MSKVSHDFEYLKSKTSLDNGSQRDYPIGSLGSIKPPGSPSERSIRPDDNFAMYVSAEADTRKKDDSDFVVDS